MLCQFCTKNCRNPQKIVFYRVYADWKVRENHIKITKSLESQGKSGKVREFKKNVVPGQGKSGKIVLPKYLIRVVN